MPEICIPKPGEGDPAAAQRGAELARDLLPDGCLFCTGDNIFCESGPWYVRYDRFPANSGHAELVPKRHVGSIFDLSPDEEARLPGMLRWARQLIEAQHGRPDAWTIGINDGAAAGQSIPHLHIHLIPRHHGDVPDPRGGIRQCAPNCDPDAWSRESQGDADA